MPKLHLIALIKWIGYLTIKVHFHIWAAVLVSYLLLWALLFIIFFPNFNRNTAEAYHYFVVFLAKLLSALGLLVTKIVNRTVFYGSIFFADLGLILRAEEPAIRRAIKYIFSKLQNKFR